MPKWPGRRGDVAEQNPSFGEQKNMGTGEPRCPRRRGWKAVVVSSAETEAETACLTAGQAAYRLQATPPRPSQQKPLACPSPATRVCPLLKATRVRLSITSLLKDTFNYAPALPGSLLP